MSEPERAGVCVRGVLNAHDVRGTKYAPLTYLKSNVVRLRVPGNMRMCVRGVDLHDALVCTASEKETHFQHLNAIRPMPLESQL